MAGGVEIVGLFEVGDHHTRAAGVFGSHGDQVHERPAGGALGFGNRSAERDAHALDLHRGDEVDNSLLDVRGEAIGIVAEQKAREFLEGVARKTGFRYGRHARVAAEGERFRVGGGGFRNYDPNRPNQAHFVLAGDDAHGFAELFELIEALARWFFARVAVDFERPGAQSDPVVIGGERRGNQDGQQKEQMAAGQHD